MQSLIGETFGQLLVLSLADKSSTGLIRWRCRCSCGNIRVCCAADLKRGHTTSCGCVHRKRASQSNVTHGKSNSGEYITWQNMMARCFNERHPRFKDYGGRGITVCERWLVFVNFLADMGPKPTSEHTIEREKNDEGYGPNNCRWATRKEQNENTRSSRHLTYLGQTMTISQWSQRLGIKQSTLSARLRLGWTVEEALSTTPSSKNKLSALRKS